MFGWSASISEAADPYKGLNGHAGEPHPCRDALRPGRRPGHLGSING
jgi:hypothetical protein